MRLGSRKKLKKELAEVNKTLRGLKSQALALEKRKAELLELLGDQYAELDCQIQHNPKAQAGFGNPAG
jgi:hypothetical protein